MYLDAHEYNMGSSSSLNMPFAAESKQFSMSYSEILTQKNDFFKGLQLTSLQFRLRHC